LRGVLFVKKSGHFLRTLHKLYATLCSSQPGATLTPLPHIPALPSYGHITVTADYSGSVLLQGKFVATKR